MKKDGSLLELKNISSLYKLRMKIIIKSAVLVVPAVSLYVFLRAMYSFIPVEASGAFLLSGLFLFVLCAYIASAIQFKENDIQEEILLLHSKSKVNYYISRELILYSISIVSALILIIYPMIKLAIHPDLFIKPLESTDVIYGGLIIIGNGLIGIALGDLFHHRIFEKRRNALLALLFVSIIAICKHAIIKKFAFLSVLNFIVPPLMDGFDMVGETDVFDPVGTIYIFIHTLIFVIAIVLIKIGILKFKKY